MEVMCQILQFPKGPIRSHRVFWGPEAEQQLLQSFLAAEKGVYLAKGTVKISRQIAEAWRRAD